MNTRLLSLAGTGVICGWLLAGCSTPDRKAGNPVQSDRATAQETAASAAPVAVAAVQIHAALPDSIPDQVSAREVAAAAQSGPLTAVITPNTSEEMTRSKLHHQDFTLIVHGQPDFDTTDCVALGTRDHWIGSGVFVSENVILTAKHIAALRPVRAWYGPIIGPNGDGQELRLNTLRTDYHWNQNVDLGIVVVDQPQDVDDLLLATAEETTHADQLEVVGYGYTNKNATGTVAQRYSVIMNITANPCSVEDEGIYNSKPGIEMIAGGQQADTCYGDSGGPALVGSKLAGIISREVKQVDGRCDLGSIFVRTAEQETWIKQEIEKNRPGLSATLPRLQ
jgi:V8-like Glu-specific endopeptidase